MDFRGAALFPMCGINLCVHRNRNDRNVFTGVFAEFDSTIDESEEGVISSAADVFAGVDSGSALTDDDAASCNKASAGCLDTEHFRI